MNLPTVADIVAAAGRIADIAVVTPLLESDALNQAAGARILIKPENLQRTGSFKVRGAANRIARLSADERARGVVAFSSGNHAQGVALAARLGGTTSKILMPADAPALKIERTRAQGGDVVFYDRRTDDRYEMVRRIAAETGRTLVAPFDDADVIAGQGTIGLELARQAAERGAVLDLALVPCSGGGLIGGIALALRDRSPATKVLAVEPEAYDDTIRSLAAGERLDIDPTRTSCCDGLQSRLGEVTFELNRQLLGGGVAVSDDEVRAAMRFAFTELKLVLEPSGAVALAAVLSGRPGISGRTVAIVLSGGNVDPELHASMIL